MGSDPNTLAPVMAETARTNMKERRLAALRGALREGENRTGELVFTAPRMLGRLLGVRLAVPLAMLVALSLPGLLRLLGSDPLSLAAALVVIGSIASWGLAFAEYCFQVPANRYGHGQFSAPQLKILQEAITLVVFGVFSVLYLRETLRWNDAVGFALILAAVVFVFGIRRDETPTKPTRPLPAMETRQAA